MAGDQKDLKLLNNLESSVWQNVSKIYTDLRATVENIKRGIVGVLSTKTDKVKINKEDFNSGVLKKREDKYLI